LDGERTKEGGRNNRMNYVMSDLHGRYDKYQEMLEKTGFKDTDRLFILGDICDRGPDGIKILLDMMERNNVIPIMGNHDLFLLMVGQMVMEMTDPEQFMASEEYADWMNNGGSYTLKAFLAQDAETEKKLLDYVASFGDPLVMEVGEQKFLLSHTAPAPYRAMDWENWDDEEATWSRDIDYQTRYYEDKILVTGHTPTAVIDEAYLGRIWKGNGHIAIDCAAFHPKGRLGCLCLDTMEEYYI